jgi:hypothetical protein
MTDAIIPLRKIIAVAYVTFDNGFSRSSGSGKSREAMKPPSSGEKFGNGHARTISLHFCEFPEAAFGEGTWLTNHVVYVVLRHALRSY